MKPFTVRTRLLAEIAKWACPDESRIHITRVLFDGLHMVATDGHRMVAAPCLTGLPPFAIDREDIAVLAAAQREITKRHSAELAFVDVSERAITVDLDEASGHGSLGRRLIVRNRDPKEFPPWETLFANLKPETPTPPEYIFQARYLAAIDQVLEAADGESRSGVRIRAWTGVEPSGYCGPMLFESAGHIRFLIMAMRAA